MLILSLLFACDTLETQLQLKSPEERLIDLRFEYKKSIDALYADYGGNQLVENINTSEKADKTDNSSHTDDNKKAVNQLMATLKNTVKAQDRAMFEEHCLELGTVKVPSSQHPKPAYSFQIPTTLKDVNRWLFSKSKSKNSKLKSTTQHPNRFNKSTLSF